MSSKIVIALRVPATPARAFEVFTRDISLWWRPNLLFRFTPRNPGVISFDPGPEGRLIETLASGQVFEIGRIRAWAPPNRLAFGWRQATFAPGQDTHVEVRFEAVGDETRVTVEHTGWETIPQEHVARHGFPSAALLQRHGEWWQSLLDALGQRLAGVQKGGRG